ncbi:GspF family T2SS innner membrane protein variant XcpS [soil metagenome]
MVEGRLSAGGRQEAMRALSAQGVRPVKLQEAGTVKPAAGAGESMFSFGSSRVTTRDLERFTRQLSNLLRASVPLARALQILARESSSKAAAEQWKAVRDLVVDGISLGDAMAQFPAVFPRVYVAMVRAGELGGFLSLVLGQVADFQAREKEMKSKLASALIYPAVLMTLAIGVMIFLLTFFIPRFQTIFTGFGGTLPLLTRVIIGISDAARTYGIFVVILIAVGIVSARTYLASAEGRRQWQSTILRMPLVGSLLARFAMARFCRMLGTLTHAGVELITALRVARESLGNQTLTDAIENTTERVKRGESLSGSLAESKNLFPPSVIEMISVAEESGRLDEELVSLAEVTEKELDGQLRTTVALAEPLLLFFMAAFIGTIFIGMVIPIFTIQDYIK